MAVITTAGSGNWNAGGTWTGGSVPGDADEAHIDSGHTVTMTAHAQVGNLVLDGGQITGAGYKITLVKTSGRLCDLSSGTISGNLDLELQGTHTTTEDFMPTTGNIRHINLNGNANQIVSTGRNTVITGNMTVSAGVLITGNDDFTAVLVSGNSGTVKTGSGTYTTTTNDWRVGTTQFQVDGGDFVIGDQMGGTWDCNSKQADIACKRFHSTIEMTNGTSLISDNSAEDVIVTATAGEANSSVYGPLQGRINLVTNSSGSKDFELKEDLEVNGRIVVSGSGEFRTYTSSNTYDLLIDGATFHDSNGSSNYSCLDMTDSAKFLSGSSSVMLDVALASNICDIGEFNGTDGQAVTGWTAYGSNTILYDSNSAKITYVDNSTGAYFMLNSTALSTSGLTLGKVYKCTFDAKINTGSVNLKWTTQSASLPFGVQAETHAYLSGATTRNENLSNTSYEKRVAYFVAGLETSIYLYVSNMSSGEVVHIDNMTVQEVMANGSTGSAGHKKSYGLDFASCSGIQNLGTGFIYTCGARLSGSGNPTHVKSSGRLCVGSGDSTEYFTGGGNTLNFNTTDILLLGNASGLDTIGFNISNMTWNCAGFYFYLPSASNHLVYWNHNSGSGQAPTVNSPTSSTAGKIHTINGSVNILQGELKCAYHDESRVGVGLVYGDTTIYDDANLNLKVSDFSTDHVDHSFESLIIKSGGTLEATPKTITITDQAASGFGYQNLTTVAKSPKNGGTIKFTDNGHVYCQESNFYNLEVALDTSSLEFRWLDSSGSLGTIDNNLIMTSGRFKFSTAGDALTVHGVTSMTSSAQFGIGSPSGTQTFNGAVRIKGGTWHMSSGANNFNAGIRNVGGTLS